MPVRQAASAGVMPRTVSRTASTANVQLAHTHPGPTGALLAGRSAAVAGAVLAQALGTGILCFAPSWLAPTYSSAWRTTCGIVLAACWAVVLVASHVRTYATLQGAALSKLSKSDSLTGWLASLTGVQSCKPRPQIFVSDTLAKAGPADFEKTPKRTTCSRSSSHSSIASNSPTKGEPGQTGQSPTTLSHTRIKADPVLAAASFDELCNHGTRWTWSNWPVKVSRFFMYIVKSLWTLWLRLSPTPTNHVMLTFRTIVRDAGEPNCNGDYLAAWFRDELMPARARFHKTNSPIIPYIRRTLELPLLGIPGIVRFIDVRTQWLDDSMNAAIRDGIKQVVVIAAGYDTRPYRLSQPGVRFYEVDMPNDSKQKQELVRKLLPASKFPRPEYVAADLSKVKLADALATTSFNTQEPALFTMEGLVYYLPASAVHQLLSCIQAVSAPKSRITMDFLHLSSLSGSAWHPGFDTLWLAVYNKGERMYSGIDERPAAVEALMRNFSFVTREVLTGRDLVKRCRPAPQFCNAKQHVVLLQGYRGSVASAAFAPWVDKPPAGLRQPQSEGQSQHYKQHGTAFKYVALLLSLLIVKVLCVLGWGRVIKSCAQKPWQ